MQLNSFLINYLFLHDITIFLDIFKTKSIKNGVFVNCENSNNIEIHKLFNKNSIRFSSKNIDGKQLTIPHYYQKIGIIVNTSCDNWNQIFESLDKYAFKSPFTWIFATKNVTEITRILSYQKIELDSDVIIASKTGDIYNLYEAFYTGFNQNGQYVVREVGFWNKTLQYMPQHRRDLQGLVMRSTVVITRNQKVVNKTFVRFLDEEQPDLHKVDPLHKLKFIPVLKNLKDMYNYTYKLQRTHSWGYQTNGTFDGMMGALQRGECDIGGSSIFIRTDRSKAIDYAIGTWQVAPYFIFRHPKHPGGFYTIYTRPLTVRVWYCIVALLVLTICILACLLKLKFLMVAGDDEDSSFSLAFLCIWSAICQQGVSISRSSTTVKLFIFVTFVYSVTLYQYYNATVVSTLLREPPKNIKTLQQLLKSNLRAGVEDILYNRDYFRQTTDPTAVAIYKTKVAHKEPYNYFTAEKGLDMVKKGGFAFFVESAVAYKIMRNSFSEIELCELQEVAIFVPQYLGAAVQKRSPYRELVAYGIRKMKESGILNRLQSHWDEARPACVHTPDSSIFSVSVQEFSSAIAVLVLGYVLALFALAYEIIVTRVYGKVIEFRH